MTKTTEQLYLATFSYSIDNNDEIECYDVLIDQIAYFDENTTVESIIDDMSNSVFAKDIKTACVAQLYVTYNEGFDLFCSAQNADLEQKLLHEFINKSKTIYQANLA
jgi:hypothetical protein